MDAPEPPKQGRPDPVVRTLKIEEDGVGKVIVIEDYAPQGTAKDMWSQYDGKQPGDPAKLGDALVQIAAMPNPPKVFVAGGDALDVITPAIEESLRLALHFLDIENHG